MCSKSDLSAWESGVKFDVVKWCSIKLKKVTLTGRLETRIFLFSGCLDIFHISVHQLGLLL
jgi:hypothetical protein